MIIHKKVIQSLGRKRKQDKKKLNYRAVGNYKFKVRYDFDSLEDLMEQKKYLLDLGWEVRYEKLKSIFVLRGYYDVKETEESTGDRGHVYHEYYNDRRCVGIIQPEIMNKKESSIDGRNKTVQDVSKRAEGKTGKVLLNAMRK